MSLLLPNHRTLNIDRRTAGSISSLEPCNHSLQRTDMQGFYREQLPKACNDCHYHDYNDSADKTFGAKQGNPSTSPAPSLTLEWIKRILI